MAPHSHRAAPRCCPECGHHPANPTAGWVLANDLATAWLLLDHTGAVTPARFCRACVPTGAVIEIACERCFDGPLLTGALAHPDRRPLAESWLRTQGWQTTPGTLCPTCVLLHRRSAERLLAHRHHPHSPNSHRQDETTAP